MKTFKDKIEEEIERFKEFSKSHIDMNLNLEYSIEVLLRSSLLSISKQAREETIEEIKNHCPIIKEIKEEGGYLWVKIPEIKVGSPYRILPDSIINNLPH